MSDKITISVPSDAPEKDLRRVRQTAEAARRNADIRRTYPDLRDQYGRKKALSLLAERHNCSKATVREVVYGRR